MRNRVDLLNAINPYVGTYFSREFIYNDILHMTEEEIKKMQAEIDADQQLQAQMQAQQQPAQPADQTAAASGVGTGDDLEGPPPYNPSSPQVEEFDKVKFLNNLKKIGVK